MGRGTVGRRGKQKARRVLNKTGVQNGPMVGTALAWTRRQ